MQKLRGCQELRSLVCPAGDLPAQELNRSPGHRRAGRAPQKSSWAQPVSRVGLCHFVTVCIIVLDVFTFSLFE